MIDYHKDAQKNTQCPNDIDAFGLLRLHFDLSPFCYFQKKYRLKLLYHKKTLCKYFMPIRRVYMPIRRTAYKNCSKTYCFCYARAGAEFVYRGRSLGALTLARDDAAGRFTVMNLALPNVMISAVRKVMI